jgi:hypothetical protein
MLYLLMSVFRQQTKSLLLLVHLLIRSIDFAKRDLSQFVRPVVAVVDVAGLLSSGSRGEVLCWLPIAH